MPAIELILSSKKRQTVKTGDFLFIHPDRVLLCDALGAHVLRQLKDQRVRHEFDFSRVYATCGRNFPARDVKTANFFQNYKELVGEFSPNFFGPQKAGVLHNVLADAVDLQFGEILLGTDSHTLTAGAFGVMALGIGVEEMVATLRFGKTWFQVPKTVKVILKGRLLDAISAKDVMFHLMREFGSEGLVGKMLEFWDCTEPGLDRDSRMVMASLAAECGVVTALFVDRRDVEGHQAFLEDSAYDTIFKMDVGDVRQPLVAWPDDPFNIHLLSESLGIPINYCFIGTCSGGGLLGLREAASVLGEAQVAPGVSLIVSPQSQEVYFKGLEEGIIQKLVAAGAVVTTPTCGPCLASHSGVLSRGDRCISTGNRNFKGRMGDSDARIYLASPRVVAKAAIAGKIDGL
ncbi:MAG: hypothetical protein J5I98_05970 [Phaeodactylibacter sp.]|nr:hypothetical protein [Phaeodactylibacter sp.]